MKVRIEHTLSAVGAAASIIGMLAAAGVTGIGLTEKLGNKELIVGLTSLIVVAFLGAFSLYLARAVKKLTHRPRIFLSYSRDDAVQALKLREALGKEGARVWFDQTDLHAGDDLKSTLESAIESSNAVVLMLSHSPGPHVKWELAAAQAKHVPILAVLGPGVESPSELRELQTITVSTDGANFDEIVAAALRVGRHEVEMEAASSVQKS